MFEQKYKMRYSLNPNGAEWSNDTSKKGQKMIERMGWSSGKGLGRKEDGNVQHVKVECKNDKRGIGCSLTRADQLSSHQDEFQAVLANLASIHNNNDDKQNKNNGNKINKENGESKNKFSNLMETAKASNPKSRYHKFIQSKNLSNKSEEDMNCIFGIKKNYNNNDIINNIIIEDTNGNKDNENASKLRKSKSYGDHLNNLNVKTPKPESDLNMIMSSSNINEYFAAKMAKMNMLKFNNNNGNRVEDDNKKKNGFTKRDDDDDDCKMLNEGTDDEYAVVNVGDDNNYEDYKYDDDDDDVGDAMIKDDCVEVDADEESVSFMVDDDEGGDDKMSKKKKKKRKKMSDAGGDEDKVKFVIGRNDDRNKRIDCDGEEKMSKKEKKKKRKTEQDIVSEAVKDDDNDNIVIDDDKVIKQIKKRKKDKMEGMKEDDGLKDKDNIESEKVVENIDGEIVLSKKERKKRNLCVLEKDVEIVEVIKDNAGNTDQNYNDYKGSQEPLVVENDGKKKIKKDKKKKKKESEINETDNVADADEKKVEIIVEDDNVDKNDDSNNVEKRETSRKRKSDVVRIEKKKRKKDKKK